MEVVDLDECKTTTSCRKCFGCHYVNGGIIGIRVGELWRTPATVVYLECALQQCWATLQRENSYVCQWSSTDLFHIVVCFVTSAEL